MSHKNNDQIVGLNTLDIRGTVKIAGKSVPVRPDKKRVFSDDEMALLLTLSDQKLMDRINMGDVIINNVIYNPQMGIAPAEQDRLASNFRFQQDVIRNILASRKKARR